MSSRPIHSPDCDRLREPDLEARVILAEGGSITKHTHSFPCDDGNDYRIKVTWEPGWCDRGRKVPAKLSRVECLHRLTPKGFRSVRKSRAKQWRDRQVMQRVRDDFERLFDTDKGFEAHVRERAARYAKEGF